MTTLRQLLKLMGPFIEVKLYTRDSRGEIQSGFKPVHACTALKFIEVQGNYAIFSGEEEVLRFEIGTMYDNPTAEIIEVEVRG